jgi:xylulokinase
VGGGAKNDLWLQIIADASGHTIHRAAVSVGACFGDALMAALGSGYYKSWADFSQTIQPGASFTPDPARHAAYQPYRRMFDQLYYATRDLMHAL